MFSSCGKVNCSTESDDEKENYKQLFKFPKGEFLVITCDHLPSLDLLDFSEQLLDPNSYLVKF